MSVVWKRIVENAKDSKVAKWIGKESFRWLIGNGNMKMFWEDIWYGEQPLRLEFPRLFRLVNNKKGEVVSSKVLALEEEDRLIWIHDNNGVFSLKKLSKLLIKGVEDISFAFDKIWKLKVPPRVKSFLWMISINRLPTKEFLTRRGVQLRQLERGCSWCDKELESANLWLISVTATYWSVWLARNELVFERKWSTANNLLFHSKMQALIQVRAVQEELRVQERSWYVWVKFNVSGVANEDEVGCGGVLRNSNGVARALFFRLVAAKDSIAAEIGAIIIVLDVYLAMGWKGKGSLITEIGSNEVFSWIEKKRLRPWMLQSIFKDIKNRMDKVGNISFLKAEKHRNEMASALALAGIKRPGMFKAWY
ncbi:hypothetical protein Golax_008855 [Gossypium laxum]|uniref:Reverse transcriptase zinc-binding domain-containing protein n=1 Tax=Gossypium laxum TaxID=34288 RepID=A0A7J9AB54_9ROSI|nr:hypothetical protein [Gossypium laxum]